MFDVEDEYAESDIPTTLIRSKADCPGIEVRSVHSNLVDNENVDTLVHHKLK